MNAKAYRVNFRPKVTREQIILTLDEILKQNGCTGCGLNGRDFTFGVNPDPFRQDISKIFTHDKFGVDEFVETPNIENLTRGNVVGF